MKSIKIFSGAIVILVFLLVFSSFCLAVEFPSPEECTWVGISIQYQGRDRCFFNSLTIHKDGSADLGLRNGCSKLLGSGTFDFSEVFNSLRPIVGEGSATPPGPIGYDHIQIMVPLKGSGKPPSFDRSAPFKKEIRNLFFQVSLQDKDIFCALFEKALRTQADKNRMVINSPPGECIHLKRGSCEECVDCLPCKFYQR